jgi:hypothetical protein
MLRSYVAVASPLGLLTLLPESEASVRHLTDRAYRRRRPDRGLCLWVVMAADDAARVAAEMEAGELRSALVSLDCGARQYGPILPH